MNDKVFATVINCIDGRVQEPVIDYMHQHFEIDFVDNVTEPGDDKVLSRGTPEEIEAIKNKVAISVTAHGSGLVAIAGHHDCAGNPVSKEEHIKEIIKAVKVARTWGLPIKVLGLWINDAWQVENLNL